MLDMSSHEIVQPKFKMQGKRGAYERQGKTSTKKDLTHASSIDMHEISNPIEEMKSKRKTEKWGPMETMKELRLMYSRRL